MKTLALLVFLAGVSVAAADDNLLRNGDFSSGITHWEGDCHNPDSGTVDPGAVAANAGVIVKLRHHDWTRVMQDFDGKVGEYLLTITYSLSPDLKFSDKADDYVNIPGKLGFSRLMPFTTSPGNWVTIVNDLGAQHSSRWEIQPKLNVTGTQTVTCKVQLDSDDSAKKGFYLVFPPGDGVISLHSIVLKAGTP